MAPASRAQVVQVSMGVAGSTGAMGLVLPSLERVWNANPGDPAVHRELRTAAVAVLVFSMTMGTMAAWAVRSPLPLLVAAGASSLVLHVYLRALRTPPREG